MDKEQCVIPPECHERFINFPHHRDSGDWFGTGVQFACISELFAGYYIHRPACRHHVLLYITGGAGEFRTEKLSGIMRENHLLFIPASRLHHYETGSALNFMALHLNPDATNWQYLRHSEAIYRPARFGGEVAALMELLFREAHRPGKDNLRVLHLFCRIVSGYIDMELSHHANAADIDCERRLENVWIQVEKHPEYSWNIDNLAAVAGLSSSHLFAVTRKFYGKKPMEIVRNMRLARAAELLQFSNATLTDIAEKSGYDSPYSFSRAFKRMYNLSPGSYRKP